MRFTLFGTVEASTLDFDTDMDCLLKTHPSAAVMSKIIMFRNGSKVTPSDFIT
jgi:hypothetical protein